MIKCYVAIDGIMIPASELPQGWTSLVTQHPYDHLPIYWFNRREPIFGSPPDLALESYTSSQAAPADWPYPR